VEALNQHFDTYLLDWGAPEAEDRYDDWEAVLRRVRRAVRRVQRDSGAAKVSVLGYCMGATLSTIYTAAEPENVNALINLAGPIDFSRGGQLATMVDGRWFSPDAIADAGNVDAQQMQSGFTALRPTLNLSKWVNFAYATVHDAAAREAFFALEAWANDNTQFPAEAYRTYIKELYQENRLIDGTHFALGTRIDLQAIRCPVLTIVASKDSICPAQAAMALNQRCGSRDTEVITMPGGHVSAVVGDGASTRLYPAIAAWLETRSALATPPARNVQAPAASPPS
jgi:polyhydroxyalkanoate synthase